VLGREVSEAKGRHDRTMNWLLKTSMTDSKISGADEPKAISVRLATVGFQKWTVVWAPVSALVTAFL
jgi:hypothetical protein